MPSYLHHRPQTPAPKRARAVTKATIGPPRPDALRHQSASLSRGLWLAAPRGNHRLACLTECLLVRVLRRSSRESLERESQHQTDLWFATDFHCRCQTIISWAREKKNKTDGNDGGNLEAGGGDWARAGVSWVGRQCDTVNDTARAQSSPGGLY